MPSLGCLPWKLRRGRDEEVAAREGLELVTVLGAHPIPNSTLDLPPAEREAAYGDGPIEYSHTMTEQLGGQLAAGFTLTRVAEAPHHIDVTARYLPAYFATRALRGSAG